jgi:hypothetical protein
VKTKTVRRLGIVLALLTFLGTGVFLLTLIVVYRSLKQVPNYYEQAMRLEPSRQAEAGDELEKRVLQLHNEVVRRGKWEALFTDEVINGWLAVDLPEKFPGALPEGITDPRVAIERERLLIACRHMSEQLEVVVNLELSIHLTDEPNVVAVRICKARAGVVPLPLKEYLDLITKAARRAGIQLRWQQVEGDPVALVTIPRNHEDYQATEIRIETVVLRDGELYLSGTTDTEQPTPTKSATVDVASPALRKTSL